MPGTKYYYNPKTLRFERAGIPVLKWSMTALGYASFGFLFFVGLLLVQNYFMSSSREKNLRAENRALQFHGRLLAQRVDESNVMLASLREKDAALHKKIFDEDKPQAAQAADGKEGILTGDWTDFNNWIQVVGKRFGALSTKARNSNLVYSWTASVDRKDLKKLTTAPALTPVEGFQIDHLVSGFGTRINPFHKGNYHHDGVDIAAPRGTNVLAAAPGRVVLAKNSDLLAGFGNFVEIDHGQGFVTRYAHLEAIQVKVGQSIAKGQVIGTVGKSGGAIAPHLHYEVIKDNTNVNPINYMVADFTSTQYSELVAASRKVNQSLD
ncbi:MAG: M23 family metallopeptidase [Cyclobacteriaceae bacterium]